VLFIGSHTPNIQTLQPTILFFFSSPPFLPVLFPPQFSTPPSAERFLLVSSVTYLCFFIFCPWLLRLSRFPPVPSLTTGHIYGMSFLAYLSPLPPSFFCASDLRIVPSQTFNILPKILPPLFFPAVTSFPFAFLPYPTTPPDDVLKVFAPILVGPLLLLSPPS